MTIHTGSGDTLNPYMLGVWVMACMRAEFKIMLVYGTRFRSKMYAVVVFSDRAPLAENPIHSVDCRFSRKPAGGRIESSKGFVSNCAVLTPSVMP